MWIGHRKEIRKLKFRALAHSKWIRSEEGLTLETSAFESLYSGQFTSSTQLTKPKYWLTDWLAGWLADWLTDWLTDSLTDSLAVSQNCANAEQ